MQSLALAVKLVKDGPAGGCFASLAPPHAATLNDGGWPIYDFIGRFVPPLSVEWSSPATEDATVVDIRTVDNIQNTLLSFLAQALASYSLKKLLR